MKAIKITVGQPKANELSGSFSETIVFSSAEGKYAKFLARTSYEIRDCT